MIATTATRSGPLALRAHTSGRGDNIILIHGGRGSHTHWIKNIDALAERYRVHALDLPGFGDAPNVAPDIEADDYLSLVHDGVRSLIGDAPTAITGFSFGGAVGADLAVRLGAQCTRLALLGPGGFGEAKGRVLDLKPAPDTLQIDPRYRAVIRHNLLALMLHRAESADEQAIDLQSRNIALGRFNSFKVSLRPTLLNHLAALKCPLLMIWGEKDLVAYPSASARAEECRVVRPDISLAMIPEAGHWVQYEAPERVNELLLTFLRG